MKAKYQSREYLLRQTKENIPVVHPRYQAIYRNLYEQEEEPMKGTLSVRILFSLILFALFVAAMNSNNNQTITATSHLMNQITHTISILSF